MGQKTHPLGFRLGITQEHRSNWYADFKQYSILLEEDDKIRTYISKLAKLASISNIHINRNGLGDQIELNIETGRPGMLVGDNGSSIKTLVFNIKKLIPTKRQITINVIEVNNVNSNASLIADLVVQQLEDRVAFRRAIREGLQCVQDKEVQGIKIEVSGRLNGAEMARSEWIREGRVPLQTLRADIDYATKEANTIYGVLGVKVWLFKNEILKTGLTRNSCPLDSSNGMPVSFGCD
jgi:small subunit ribosomal protein S3